MIKFIRFILQIIFWIIIWIVVGVSQNYNTILSFTDIKFVLFQSILIGIVIYFSTPILLFYKKYYLYSVFTIVIILLTTYFTTKIQIKADLLNELQEFGHMDNYYKPSKSLENLGVVFSVIPASRSFINFLILTVTYFMSTIIEVFELVKIKEDEAVLIKNENLSNELKLLKSQINPHFLFNSLNNIYALSAIDTEKTQLSISYLSSMLRYVLYDCDQKMVSIDKEVIYIENYIKLFSMKSSKELPINFDKDLGSEKTQVAPMIFLPYVENAFKHSNVGRDENSFININLVNYVDKNKIYFCVENSKPQRKIVKDDVGGIGLANVKKRLSILYSSKHKLKITNNETFKVELFIET